MADKSYLIFDYETYSECDLKTSGAYEYARHPSTEILCVGYVYGTRDELPDAEPQILVPPTTPTAHDTEFMHLLTLPDTVLVAHNAFFEQCITTWVLPRYKKLLRGDDARRMPLKKWICTAALARAVGIPGNLEGATAALGLAHQKDMEGHKLMMKLCKPRTPSKKDPSTRHQDPDDLARLYEYCKNDILAERELFLTLPPLPKKERKFWLLNQELNHRGFAVDRDLVQSALYCIDRETTFLDKRFRKLTGLNSARQNKALLHHLDSLGVPLPNVQAATITEALEKMDMPKEARQILEIRQAAAKSSTTKYVAFEARTRSDGRARDNVLYFGAHTGRDAGMGGVQPQNLFKSTMPHADVLTGIDLIKARDVTAIRALYQRPMELYASALRSCIVAPKGHVLDVGDFATIEVRVLFWLAGNEKGLEALRLGEPIYSQMAAKIFEEDADEIEAAHKAGDKEGYRKRQLGKATVLGAGFGIGVGGEKFQMAAKIMAGINISLSLAQKAVHAYREANPRVVKFWDTIERAATMAMQNPGKAYKHGVLKWKKEGNWLTCELPIGRKLYYFSPRMMQVRTLYGEKMALTYRVVDSKTKQFMRVTTWGGKLTENVVQAVARDLLMEAQLRLAERGHVTVLPVHDELVTERADTTAKTDMFEIMAENPSWADGLPIKVEGWSESRYRK